MQFGENFAIAIRESGKMKVDVAKHFDVSRQTIRAWEIGEALPDHRHQKKVAQFMGMDLRDLLRMIKADDEERKTKRKLFEEEKKRNRGAVVKTHVMEMP